MASMSYCRFQNTVNDLSDCYENLTNKLSRDEHYARRQLVVLCQEILEIADSNDWIEEDWVDEETEEG